MHSWMYICVRDQVCASLKLCVYAGADGRTVDRGMGVCMCLHVLRVCDPACVYVTLCARMDW